MRFFSRLICSGALIIILPAVAQNSPSSSYFKDAKLSIVSGKLQIQAKSPRPLAQSLDALQQKFGWVVDYEDPQYISLLDVVDGSGPAGPTKYPAGGTFDVELPASDKDPEKALNAIVDSYNHSKNPGRFEVRKGSNGSFYVVGNAAHDEKGAVSSQPVLLDSLITLPAEQRSINETLAQICQLLAAQTHTDVTIGISPRSLLERNAAKIGGVKIAARDLLQQSLQATHHSLYWRLIYDPSSKGYFLDIHSAH